MTQIDELEDKYLALDRLENPAKRWSLEDMEQGRDMEG